MEFASEIKVGTMFRRVDMNRNVWLAEVTSRTEHFVKVRFSNPYKKEWEDFDGRVEIKELMDIEYICLDEESKPSLFAKRKMVETKVGYYIQFRDRSKLNAPRSTYAWRY